VYAAAVVPGSPAAKEGSLAVGDRIVAVSLKALAKLSPTLGWVEQEVMSLYSPSYVYCT
jgi:C-terminal processing protease CtpA/Prc